MFFSPFQIYEQSFRVMSSKLDILLDCFGCTSRMIVKNPSLLTADLENMQKLVEQVVHSQQKEILHQYQHMDHRRCHQIILVTRGMCSTSKQDCYEQNNENYSCLWSSQGESMDYPEVDRLKRRKRNPSIKSEDVFPLESIIQNPNTSFEQVCCHSSVNSVQNPIMSKN